MQIEVICWITSEFCCVYRKFGYLQLAPKFCFSMTVSTTLWKVVRYSLRESVFCLTALSHFCLWLQAGKRCTTSRKWCKLLITRDACHAGGKQTCLVATKWGNWLRNRVRIPRQPHVQTFGKKAEGWLYRGCNWLYSFATPLRTDSASSDELRGG